MRFLLCAFLSGAIAFSATAQDRRNDGPAAADFFVKIPSEDASQLSQTARLDMIDYFNSGSSVKVENRLGRKVGLKRLEQRLIQWQDDDSVTSTLVVFPVKLIARTDTVFALIRTYNGQMPDSEVRYFENGWFPINNDLWSVPNPRLKDWLTTKDKSEIARAKEEIPFVLSTAEYDADNDDLVFTNRTAEYYVAGDTPASLSKLKPELRYHFTGRMFVKKEAR